MKASIYIDIRKEVTNKIGNKPIFLHWVKNGKTMKISLKLSVPFESWSGAEPTWVYDKGKHKYHLGTHINTLLSREMQKARDILLRAELDSEDIDFETFKIRFTGAVAKVAKTDFFKFYDDYVSYKTEKGVSKNTLVNYKTFAKRISLFKTEIYLEDIDANFIRELEVYIIKKGIGNNTKVRIMSDLKTVLNLALQKKVIKHNPFLDFDGDLRYAYKAMPTLTQDEIYKLQKLYDSAILKETLHNALRLLLFSCFTGLPYGEIVALMWEDLEQHEHEGKKIYCINKTREKTKNYNAEFFVPLMLRAEHLLPAKIEDKQNVFKVPAGHKLNEYVRELLQMIGFNSKKHFTFHCARHTFGTIMLNENEMPEHIIQAMMGHKTARMTKHYAKTNKNSIISQMKKNEHNL